MEGTRIQCKCGQTKTKEQLFLMHVDALAPHHIHTKAQHQQNDKIYIYFKRLYSLGRFLLSQLMNHSARLGHFADALGKGKMELH